MTAFPAPALGPAVPRRGNRLTRWLGRRALRMAGWRFVGSFPDVAKAVIVVAPHTSNWDFPVGVAAMYALGFRVSWLAKHTLFRWPLGPLMRWLGGVPVRRDSGSGTVAQAVERFRRAERLLLVIAPEGTRAAVSRWRMGFAHIARGAAVAVVPIAFDWRRHQLRLGPAMPVTGDLAADEAALRSWFGDAAGLRDR